MSSKVTVIAFYIAAIKVLMGRLFSSVIMYKIIRWMRRAIIRDAFWQSLGFAPTNWYGETNQSGCRHILNEGHLSISLASWLYGSVISGRQSTISQQPFLHLMVFWLSTNPSPAAIKGWMKPTSKADNAVLMLLRCSIMTLIASLT